MQSACEQCEKGEREGSAGVGRRVTWGEEGVWWDGGRVLEVLRDWEEGEGGVQSSDGRGKATQQGRVGWSLSQDVAGAPSCPAPPPSALPYTHPATPRSLPLSLLAQYVHLAAAAAAGGGGGYVASASLGGRRHICKCSGFLCVGLDHTRLLSLACPAACCPPLFIN